MTACVNRKHTKKVAAVVTASLVGALSLGVAPVAAMATDGDITLLEATDVSSAQDGTIVAFEDGYEAGETFVANGKQQGLKPTKVQPWKTTGEDAQLNVTGVVYYKIVNATTAGAVKSDDPSADADTKGRTIDGKPFYYDGTKTYTLPTDPGTYAVFAKVTAADGTTDVSVKEGALFTIATASLEDATLYQVNASDPDDTSDTTYTFNAGEWQLTRTATSGFGGLARYNRLALKSGDSQLDMTCFTTEYYTADGKKIAAGNIVAAGDYYMVVSGKTGTAYVNQKERFDFTIAPYDLATSNIVAEDVPWKGVGGDTTTDILTVDNEPWASSWLKNYVTVDYPNVAISKGEASLTVNVDEDALKNVSGIDCTGSIINSQDVTYNVVTAIVSPDDSSLVANYGTGAFGGTLNVDFSADPTNAFDESKVAVSYKDPATGEQVETECYTLRVVNTKTQEVGGTEMLTQPGTYTVQVVLDSAALDFDVAGKSNTMTVNVTKGVIGITDIVFTYKDKVVTVNDLTTGIMYTPGVNVMDDIDVAVKTANGDVDPSEYEVVVEKLVDGEWVEADSIENAGTYKVSVVAEGYTYTDTENFINVNVAKRDLSDSSASFDIRVKNTFNYIDNGTPMRVLPYTGEEIVAEYEWTCDGGETWFDLPAADYTVSYEQNGDEVDLKEDGNYTAEIVAKKDSENYEKSGDADVNVSKLKVFLDVPMDQWYSQSVYNALRLQYINGYGDGQFFGPENPIKRGDVAVVLYNMSGASRPGEVSEDVKTEYKTYTTDKFSDVDEGMYYNEAIGWAAKLGIVNGYEGKFRPEDTVTAEEFAAMLANYAKAQGVDVDAAEADLSAYGDADQISEWAEQSVEWAVANDVMGGYELLRPQEQVSRARVAAMAVNYQPEGAESVLVPRK